jgi:hypothetical protein
MSKKISLPTCKGCKREAVELYDLNYNLSFFCHYCRKRVISEEEIQAWFDSGPIDKETLEMALSLIQGSKNGKAI